jgi:hypothetical protein
MAIGGFTVSSFEDLKRNPQRHFDRVRQLVRYDLGTHKRTRLKRAGCSSSGSLLHDDVAKRHAAMLFANYKVRLAKISKIDPRARLRFLTVLHAVTPLNKRDVMRAVDKMEAALRRAFKGTKAWLLGAIEVEIVSIALLRRIGSLTEDETRKLDVLGRLRAEGDDASSGILVHFHGVVDLGTNAAQRDDELRRRFDKIAAWQRSRYQVKMTRLFDAQTTLKSLSYIASYVTKGGNEKLRYSAGFGRDLDSDLDAKIWRSGMGRADQGGETYFDERGLTICEVAFLDEVWCEIMRRRRDKRGYLVRIG